MTLHTHTLRTAALKAHGYYRQILDKTRSGQPLDEHDTHVVRQSIEAVRETMEICARLMDERQTQ